jgi:hypothetical protein
MNTKFVLSVAGLGFALNIFLGVVCFGDRFVTGCVVFLFLFVCAIAWPLTFLFGRLVQRQKLELFRALVIEDRWIQDVLLAELDVNTRGEFLKRLGRDANKIR